MRTTQETNETTVDQEEGSTMTRHIIIALPIFFKECLLKENKGSEKTKEELGRFLSLFKDKSNKEEANAVGFVHLFSPRYNCFLLDRTKSSGCSTQTGFFDGFSSSTYPTKWISYFSSVNYEDVSFRNTHFFFSKSFLVRFIEFIKNDSLSINSSVYDLLECVI